eukprot:TRINITY_DN7407_c0_g1_i1.p1 TRINITY_DN7407_c0_g1~~TRINITY_DN7407_c0_g1_i1.p1  ORF type:complete len:272 (-),score=57.02 TRINITY_DN7407_c0_g1_i1:68-775(-)
MRTSRPVQPSPAAAPSLPPSIPTARAQQGSMQLVQQQMQLHQSQQHQTAANQQNLHIQLAQQQNLQQQHLQHQQAQVTQQQTQQTQQQQLQAQQRARQQAEKSQQGLQTQQERVSQRKRLHEFIDSVQDYTPTIPDVVTNHYLSQSGFETTEPKLTRFISLAAHKFLFDVVTDAIHYTKIRRGTKPSEKKVVLTLEDLVPALAEHGMNVKKPPYYCDKPAVDRPVVPAEKKQKKA